MAGTLEKIQGIRSLLTKFRARARSTQRHYLHELPPDESPEWPKDVEIAQIEQLVREVAQAVTGSDSVSPNVWKPARDFAHEVQRPASERQAQARSNDEGQRLYEESQAEFFWGLQLWADHTSDFLEYLVGFGSASTPEGIRQPPDSRRASSDVAARDVEYDVALSYAGEDRHLARELANEIRARRLKVFYDEYEAATLWGRDLYLHLSNVYKNKARFCLVIVSANYGAKLWTKHELRAAQARAFAESSDYILPLRLDDTEIDGILPTTAYLTMKDRTVPDVVDLLVAKLVNSGPAT